MKKEKFFAVKHLKIIFLQVQIAYNKKIFAQFAVTLNLQKNYLKIHLFVFKNANKLINKTTSDIFLKNLIKVILNYLKIYKLLFFDF